MEKQLGDEPSTPLLDYAPKPPRQGRKLPTKGLVHAFMVGIGFFVMGVFFITDGRLIMGWSFTFSGWLFVVGAVAAYRVSLGQVSEQEGTKPGRTK